MANGKSFRDRKVIDLSKPKMMDDRLSNQWRTGWVNANMVRAEDIRSTTSSI
jgi:hypothetical protein